MAYRLRLDNLPMGHAASAARPNEQVPVIVREFLSPEDGQELIQRLEGIPNDLLEKVSDRKRIIPSQVDHLLAVIHPDKTLDLYVNELSLSASVQPTRSVKAGEAIYRNDIADISYLNMGGVEIPDDCGFLFVFSAGWRKGLFYDFGPLTPERGKREFDCRTVLAKAYAQLMFQERLGLSDDDWSHLLRERWFPFIGLSDGAIKKLVNWGRQEWNTDELLPDIVSEVEGNLDRFLEAWKRRKVFGGHREILDRACERYRKGDYISATGLFYPRIEGVLRSYNQMVSGAKRITYQQLVDSAVKESIEKERLLVMPERFAEYLRDVYLAGFDPRSVQNEVSRHCVAHGTAAESEFSQKAATLAILVLRQLTFCLDKDVEKNDNESTP